MATSGKNKFRQYSVDYFRYGFMPGNERFMNGLSKQFSSFRLSFQEGSGGMIVVLLKWHFVPVSIF